MIKEEMAAAAGTSTAVWLPRLKNASVFFLGRYPFFSALLLLMIVAERAPADNKLVDLFFHFISFIYLVCKFHTPYNGCQLAVCAIFLS